MNNLEKVDSRYIYMRCCDTDSRDKSHEQTDQGSSAVSFGILILSLYIVCYRCYLFHGLLVRSLGTNKLLFLSSQDLVREPVCPGLPFIFSLQHRPKVLHNNLYIEVSLCQSPRTSPTCPEENFDDADGFICPLFTYSTWL